MKHGFEKYCKDYEKIENYEKAKKDDFKGWECHHRLETYTPEGERRIIDITKKELIALGMYYHRPAEELIFLTIKEHHEYRKGKRHTEEARRKMSEARKGKHLSEEHKKKIGEAQKGKKLSAETRRKLAESAKGKKMSEEARRKMSESAKGNKNHLGKKHTDETRNKMSIVRKGMRWYNNGKINIRAKECPDGFVPGQLR